MRMVIVGATSLIAEHCARLWIKKAARMDLIGRNQEKLERLASDLRIRHPKATVLVYEVLFDEPKAIQALVDELTAHELVDVVLIAQGMLPNQAQCQVDLNASRDAMMVNAISPVLFAEAFLQHFEVQKKGRLAIIGSVAGDRGRKSNYIYGASKGLLARYVEGVQQRFFGTKIHITLVKPGPTETPMTEALKQKGMKLAQAMDVAFDIVSGIEAGKRVVYTPARWRWVMALVRWLPDWIFNRLNV